MGTRILLLQALSSCLVIAVYAQDPCAQSNHQLIAEPHRSTQFQPEPTDRLLCDDGLRSGWYVFDNSDEMPTSCVTQFHCGTHYPLWMQGTHPSQADGIVQRKACSNIHGSTSRTCCDFSLDIQVKNCGTFYVYYLRTVPACAMAYCAGTKKVCDVGGHLAAGGNCPDLYPKLTSPPVLSKPEVTTSEVRFSCKIDYPLGQRDVGFEVTWTVDGQELMDKTGHSLQKTITGDPRVAYLNAAQLEGHLGKELKCNVRSFHPLIGKGVISPPLSSRGFWAGIRVSPLGKINLDEGGAERTVTLESTVPLLCTNLLFASECKLRIKLAGLKNPEDASLSGCHYDLKLDNATGTFKTSFKVKATRDFIKDKDFVQEIAFQPIKTFEYQMWNNYAPNPITVQIRTWPCGSYKPCACAVIAREGNDVIEIDMCEKRKDVVEAPTVSYPSAYPLEGTTVSRSKTGKTFYLNFPSGARIKVETNALTGESHNTTEFSPYMDIDVQAPPDDFGASEGLCGNWNGNESDDFIGGDGIQYQPSSVANFSKSWILPASTSMFHQVPKYEQHLAPKFEYCSCKQGPVDCTSVGKGAINPSKPKDGSIISDKNKHPRRSAHDYTDHYPDRDIPLDPGVTAKHQARTACYNSIAKSSLYSRCHHTTILTNILDGCVEDIKYSDNVETFELAHMNAFDSICYNELAKDPRNIEYINGNPVVSSSIMTCPNQCSKRGRCVGTTCHCDHGFTSADCSVRMGVAPVIHRIRGDGHCDIRKRPCRQVNVIVDNIVDSSHLACRITPLDLSDGAPVVSGPAVTYKAEFLSFLEVQCPIPEHNVMKGLSAKGFKISITSDGQTNSQEGLFIVSDSYCSKCTADGVCTQKPDSCFIDGVCYRNGDQNGDNQVCDSSVTTNDWTSLQSVQEIDHYTATFTGCRCPYNTRLYDCACCQNGGCQCGETQPNQCYDCHSKALCGLYPNLFPPPNQ